MKILILYNPRAGKCKAHIHAAKLKKQLFTEQNTVITYASKSIESMLEFFKTMERDFDALVIIGGDGTVGPTIDAMIKNNIDIPIYCYGRGTANDMASFLGTNCRPRRAARYILANQHSPVDSLLVNNTDHAINVACGGAFTNGVTRYNKRSKRMLGKFAYMAKAAIVALRLKGQTLRFTVDDNEFDLNVYLFYILNSKNVGGLKNSCPVSDISDGLLDLICIKSTGFFGKIGIAISQLRGRLHLNKNVTHVQGKTFHVTHTSDDIKPNFTLTDIDGNAYQPYPMHVALGPQIRVIHRCDCH